VARAHAPMAGLKSENLIKLNQREKLRKRHKKAKIFTRYVLVRSSSRPVRLSTVKQESRAIARKPRYAALSFCLTVADIHPMCNSIAKATRQRSRRDPSRHIPAVRHENRI